MTPVDLTRATEATEEVKQTVHDLFEFKSWDQVKISKGVIVRLKLEEAYCAIIDNAPPSPTRTRALNHIVDARMLANAAITHEGRF